MRLLGTVLVGLLEISARPAWAQQLAGTQMFVDYPGLSDNCKDTLATNVTCPPLLLILSQRWLADTVPLKSDTNGNQEPSVE